MATQMQEQEAQARPVAFARGRPAPLVLRGVPWEVYVQLRDEPRNYGYRMTYLDGTLEIMSPTSTHENPSRRLGLLVPLVCERLGFTYHGVASTTFRIPGAGRTKGAGREADEAFYIANEPAIRGQEEFDLAVVPPPDLWIEVDNRSSSRLRLPAYARLGIPEVWRLDSRKKTLWFGRKAGETYEAIERSVALPVLTPALVLEALALREGLSEWEWKARLVAWVGNLPAGAPGAERGA